MHSYSVLPCFALIASVTSISSNPLPQGVISIPLHRIKNQNAYAIDFEVGNPPQKTSLLADTGSNLVFFESAIDNVCKKSLCRDGGFYDNATSTTSIRIRGGFNNAVLDKGFGSIMNDTLRFGSQQVPNMQFGVVEEHHASFPITQQLYAILGLGAYCETNKCDAKNNFIQQLYNRGFIKKRAFSVYLGPNEPTAQGTLLLGGIDIAKRKGPVHKISMVDPHSPEGSNMGNRLYIEGIRLETFNNSSQKFRSSEKNAHVLLDTGSPRWYMPHDVFKAVIKYFGLPENIDPFSAHYEVDCKYRNPNNDKIISQFRSGAEIAVPLHTLPTIFNTGNCFLDIGPFDGLMGDPFLRGVYATFNYDDLSIELSEVEYTAKTNIVPI